jgi:hypothetical protein
MNVQVSLRTRWIFPDSVPIDICSVLTVSQDSVVGDALENLFGVDVFSSAVIRIERIPRLED